MTLRFAETRENMPGQVIQCELTAAKAHGTLRTRVMRQLASLAAAASVLASAGPSLASSGVSFANLKGGEALRSPVHVEFAVQGYQVRPASEGLQEGSGHFHVLIDAEDAVEEGVTIPFDERHRHYGKAQLADDLVLTPGKHKLALQFANALHESYGPTMAKHIEVNVLN